MLNMNVTSQIAVPTLLIDKRKVESNVMKMKNKTDLAQVNFRPHFKTHQSNDIGNWLREWGINQIAVSSVSMAHYFAAGGFNDITIALPVNLREIKAIDELASKIKLNILIESVDIVHTIDLLLNNMVNVFIEMDVGAKRTGISVDNTSEVMELAETIRSSNNLKLRGLLCHAGQTYKVKGVDEIRQIAHQSASKLNKLKVALNEPNLIVSWGDTPSCSMLDDLTGFDEWRPGNFVLYDVMQYHIGSCQLADVAVAMACPVVSVQPERNQLVIYGGAVHFSKEHIKADNGFELYGYIVRLHENGWSAPIAGAWLCALSQEHGIVQLPPKSSHLFQIGDLIGVLPVHACLSVSAMGKMLGLDGQIIACMR